MKYFEAPGFMGFIVTQRMCEYFDISERQIKSSSRKVPIPDARNIIMWYGYKMLKYHPVEVALGINRGRPCVYAAVKKIERLMEVDILFKQKVEGFIKYVQ